ncbi:MAG: hypothetical protein RIG77_02020 [Cyclobacteriaceae bacterium]
MEKEENYEKYFAFHLEKTKGSLIKVPTKNDWFIGILGLLKDYVSKMTCEAIKY